MMLPESIDVGHGEPTRLISGSGSLVSAAVVVPADVVSDVAASVVDAEVVSAAVVVVAASVAGAGVLPPHDESTNDAAKESETIEKIIFFLCSVIIISP